ncbi:ester cyclase [Blastococcus sp. SYSU D00813]
MDAVRMADECFRAFAAGDQELLARTLHPEAVNHMSTDEPPACAQVGLPGFMASSAWLRLAWPGFGFELIETAADDERVITHVWMRGRQTGPFVVFPPGAEPVAFPPTGRSFAVRQCHIYRLRDGLFAEHIAVRDDLGMMTQLGHLPPAPAAIARMARFRVSGAHGRAVTEAVNVAQQAADAARGFVRQPG